MSRITRSIYSPPEEVSVEPVPFVLERLHPATSGIDYASISSLKSLLALVKEAGLVVRMTVTLVENPETLYLSKSAEHKIGDVKTEMYRNRCIFVDAVSPAYDFSVQAAWYEKFPKFRDGRPKPSVFEFENARIGGPKSGNRPELFVTGSTQMMSEVKKCLI